MAGPSRPSAAAWPLAMRRVSAPDAVAPPGRLCWDPRAMSGETKHATALVAQAMAAADQDPKQDKDSMGRALISAVLTEFLRYRSAEDVAAELQYLADNLEEDEFVVTRGC